MKKRVNGKTVEIDEFIGLFHLAGEGVALNRRASSLVRNTIENRSEFVRDIVNEYDRILNDLVFPLNMIEEGIKYMTIALVLKERLREKYGEVQMQVGRSICIEVEPDTTLRLLAGTWAIEETQNTYKPTELELDSYSYDTGYKEYKWALDKMLNNESTKGFYKEFMGDFLNACKNEQFILDWELEHMLDFGYVPEQVELPENKLEDIDNDMEYFLDIYSTGQRETNDTMLRLVVSKDGSKASMEKKKIKVYNYEVYGKKLTDAKGGNKTEKVQGAQGKGFSSVFDVLLTDGISDDIVTQLKYYGIISQNQILFEVNKEVYLAPFDSYAPPKRLISNVSLYGFESGRVYVSKTERQHYGVTKETIYSYELATGKARICRTKYTA